jgi:hypothetical protein
VTELPAWLRGMASVLFREARDRVFETELCSEIRQLAIHCQTTAARVELGEDDDEEEFLAEAPTVPGRNATRVGVAPPAGE